MEIVEENLPVCSLGSEGLLPWGSSYFLYSHSNVTAGLVMTSMWHFLFMHADKLKKNTNITKSKPDQLNGIKSILADGSLVLTTGRMHVTNMDLFFVYRF